ncbi:hypothetical protein GUJ93_ZPchr0012g21342 [Zizania palustris]|uniref:Uncharacterized protein n=1 Tax=Zizania palustris TaxID=103762 RepID=A0A8J6BX14_ZIZPA|nr:hypothetical protein GUJ93_ZPchr0012g21342 [Zizania palustris]
MGARKYGRTALTDITNHVKEGTCQSPYDNDVRKREEKNRKQREYRARIKAESSLNISGTQQAPDDNELDQPSPYGQGYSTDLQGSMVLQANDSTLAGSILSPCGTGISTILQGSSVEDKENHDQEDENIDWLHRNDNYVKLHKDSVNKREGRNIRQREYRARRKAEEIDEYREWRINKKHYGYKRCAHDNMDETNICQTPLQQKNGEPDDTLESALFEPTHLCCHDEDCLQDADELENTEDDESRQFRGEDAYDSYCLSIDCVNESTTEDMCDLDEQYDIPSTMQSIVENTSNLKDYGECDDDIQEEVLIFQSLLIQVNIPMT